MDAGIDTTVAALLAYWASEDPAYRRVVTHGEAEVRALEARFGVELPTVFRSYLLFGCSTRNAGGGMDASGHDWWELDRIDLVSRAYEHELDDAALGREATSSLIFADHLMWSMAWAICCGAGANAGRVFLVDQPGRFVADDFAAFVADYLKDPSRLL